MYASYTSGMNAYDKKVRNLDNYNDPVRYISQLSTNQKALFKDDKTELSSILNKYARLKSTSYQIVFFKDDAIENGYPHTVKDTIMLPVKYYFNLPEKQKRVSLLLHEFIHVYQRSHPFEFNQLLIYKLGLKVDNFINAYYNDSKRSNPDINRLLYDEGEGVHRVMLYNTQQSPTSLADAQIYINKATLTTRETVYSKLVKDYSQLIHIQLEHPYEAMACILSNMLYNNNTHTHAHIARWLTQF
jgi:hypothetical protein